MIDLESLKKTLEDYTNFDARISDMKLFYDYRNRLLDVVGPLIESVQELQNSITDCDSEICFWREEFESEVRFAEACIRELEAENKRLSTENADLRRELLRVGEKY